MAPISLSVRFPNRSEPLLQTISTENVAISTEDVAIRRRRFSEFCKMYYIDCNDKIGGILIAVVGLLTSLWADCILVISFTQDYDPRMELFIEKTIINTSQYSHFLIVITCTAGLLYGIKVKNKSYFSPWIFTKIMELCVLFMGIIFIGNGGSRRYVGIIPFGVSFFLFGVYITICVWHTYNNNIETEERRPTPEEDHVNSHPQIRDPPPSYYSYDVHG